MKLVDDWKQAWKWISVNCMVVAAALQGAWVYLPDDLHESVPKGLVGLLTISILALGITGRLMKQEGRKDDEVP